jgi:hypothetical protein
MERQTNDKQTARKFRKRHKYKTAKSPHGLTFRTDCQRRGKGCGLFGADTLYLAWQSRFSRGIEGGGGGGQVLALDTLEKLIQSARHESTKLTACVSWLNMFMKYHEAQDVENRLTELEKAVKNGKK